MNTDLPALPEPAHTFYIGDGKKPKAKYETFSAKQMLAFRAEAIAARDAEIARLGKLAADYFSAAVEAQELAEGLSAETARLQAALAAQQPAAVPNAHDIRAIVQQAYMALEELQGPGFLIGGVMHYRIGLILPKLNEAINALAAAPAVQPSRDREADRARFTDPAFNRWLDEGISDAGHTVWDAVGDTQAAWQGWENRQHYVKEQPAEAAAPIYLVATGDVSESGREQYERWDGKPPPLCDYEGPLYAAPTAAPSAPSAQPVAHRRCDAFPERDTSKPAEQQGLFRKFIVTRTDGSSGPGGKHEHCAYFVLDMDHDAHAPAALRAYAEACSATHPQLAADLKARFGEAQPVAVPPWQPIETAPKDGTEVLLYAPGRLTYGAWTEPSDVPEIKYRDGFAPEPEWEEFAPFWSSWDGGFTEDHPPTHWMPLPAAPGATTKGNAA